MVRRYRARRLFAESLEDRRLLAGDLGVVQNPIDALDVNHDRSVTPLDALYLINEINDSDDTPQVLRAFYDTSGDGVLSALDVLHVVNQLNDGDSAGLADSLDQFQRQLSEFNLEIDLLQAGLDVEGNEQWALSVEELTDAVGDFAQAREQLHAQLDQLLESTEISAEQIEEILQNVREADFVNDRLLEGRAFALVDDLAEVFPVEQYLTDLELELPERLPELPSLEGLDEPAAIREYIASAFAQLAESWELPNNPVGEGSELNPAQDPSGTDAGNAWEGDNFEEELGEWDVPRLGLLSEHPLLPSLFDASTFGRYLGHPEQPDLQETSIELTDAGSDQLPPALGDGELNFVDVTFDWEQGLAALASSSFAGMLIPELAEFVSMELEEEDS